MTSQRATKKQQELLSFVDGFIKGNGYGPSYREVMKALGYKSVSTVAVHVDALVAKGYLQKGGDYSARSIELVERTTENQHLAWLRVQAKKYRNHDQLADADTIDAAIAVLEKSTANDAKLA